MRALPHLTICPFAWLFARPCPGCGLTRATWDLLHGDLSGAHAHHPLILLVLACLGWLAFDLALGRIWAVPALATRARLRGPLLAGLCAALVVVWLLRFAGAWGGPVAIG
ncbi:MAG TPA: DUF2752 domain-containing protein [Polyangiaceae bacterium]|nr:DUF2752 domain-containing protein [Polyangiaceae bacterium]